MTDPFQTPELDEPPAPTVEQPSRWSDFIRRVFSTDIKLSAPRMKIAAIGFLALYAVICGKLVYLGFKPEPATTRRAAAEAVAASRPDIIDRNGEVLASDVKVMSVFAEPRRLVDKDEATELLTAVLPDVDSKDLRDRLGSKKGFVWVKREVSAHQRDEVFHLGLPGVGLIAENKRVYPNGPIGAHVLGYANVDNQGIAGIEKYIDGQGLADLHNLGFGGTPDDLQPISLSLDIRATHALRDEVVKGVEHFRAKAGAAAILDVNTGEVVALASYPDYDPNKPTEALDPLHINRFSVGVYEMGSTFKALTIAMALELGQAESQFTSRRPRRPILRPLQDSRLSRAEPRAHRAGGFHLFVERRHGAHGDGAGRREAQGVSAQDGPAHAHAHGTARKRRAHRSEQLGRVEHHDHRLRSWSRGGAVAGDDGRRRADERRLSDHADLPEALA